tara:strand:- start:203 stop:463 length:261 start_codon:yes stop_codon:yes gene_type:complete
MLALIDGETPGISLDDDGIPPIWIGKYRANIEYQMPADASTSTILDPHSSTIEFASKIHANYRTDARTVPTIEPLIESIVNPESIE